MSPSPASPFARYAVLDVDAGRLVGCEMIALAYDHAAAAGACGVARPARLGACAAHGADAVRRLTVRTRAVDGAARDVVSGGSCGVSAAL